MEILTKAVFDWRVKGNVGNTNVLKITVKTDHIHALGRKDNCTAVEKISYKLLLVLRKPNVEINTHS